MAEGRIIVSLTSYPPRIDNVHMVVESLFRQTLRADEIILYLSLDEFPEMEAGLPESLRKLIVHKGFRIEWVRGNLKSHKKYFYALQKYKDAIIITVDDDKIYAETMISDLLKSHKRFPKAVSARIVRIMFKKGEMLEPYRQWEKGEYLEEYIDVPRMDLCAIGAGGICYSSSLVNKKWFNKEEIAEMAEDCDDLWMKYNEIISNIPVVYTKPSQEDITIENSQVYRLFANNLYGDGNDQCICKLFKLLRKQNSDIYKNFFQNLMTWKEYIIQKKKYYSGVYNAVFDRFENLPVYVYGAGKAAQYILMILEDLGLTQRLTAIIVSDKFGCPMSLYNLQVKSLSEMDADQQFGVIFGVSEANRKEIMDRLVEYSYQKIELDMQIIMRCYQY